MRKLLSMLLLAALLLAGVAGAEGEAGVAYKLPEGAVMVPASELGAQQVPEGLQEMYALMQKQSDGSTVFVFRMKHGRALASIGISPLAESVDINALYGMWQSIAKTMSRDMSYVNANDSCATVGERYGREALIIDTEGVVGEDSTLLLDFDCVAFVVSNTLIEIWSASPADTTYVFDAAAYGECEDDKRDMAALMESLDFSSLFGAGRDVEKPKSSYESERYIDPKGRFETDIIKGCSIITAESAEGEVTRLRTALVSKYGDGASVLFDKNYEDVKNEDATYILLPDLSGAAVVYRVYVPAFTKATTDDLLMTAPAVAKSLAGDFGAAHCLYDDGTISVSGVEHAWTAYWIRSGQTDILLNLIATVDDGGYLRELDVFKMTDDPDGELCDALMYMVINTMKYLTPEGQP